MRALALALEPNASRSSTVVSIVVTYHSPSHLERCLRAIGEQARAVDAVLVVDNSEDAEPGCTTTSLPSAEIPMITVCPSENLGPAGGFALGMEAAVAAGSRYLWLMDDDVAPAPDCLGEQLEVMRRVGDRAVLLPDMLDRSTGQRRTTWGWCAVLTSSQLCRSVGIPRADFFWGFEDLEWIIDRTAAAGVPRARVETASATVTMRPSEDSYASWKYYYYARNVTYLGMWGRRHIPLVQRWKRQGHHLHALWQRASRGERIGVSRFLVVRGVVDGGLKRMGRRVEPKDADRPSV